MLILKFWWGSEIASIKDNPNMEEPHSLKSVEILSLVFTFRTRKKIAWKTEDILRMCFVTLYMDVEILTSAKVDLKYLGGIIDFLSKSLHSSFISKLLVNFCYKDPAKPVLVIYFLNNLYLKHVIWRSPLICVTSLKSFTVLPNNPRSQTASHLTDIKGLPATIGGEKEMSVWLRKREKKTLTKIYWSASQTQFPFFNCQIF